LNNQHFAMKILNTLLISLLAYSASAQVGIGTSDPDSPLDIEAVDAAIDINNSNSSDDPKINFQLTNVTTFSIGVDNADSKFKIGTTAPATGTAVTVQSTGEVGIGTTSPQALLHIKQTTADAYGVYVDDGTSWISLVPNLATGGYNPISEAGDVGLFFSTDNNSAAVAGNGLVIAAHSTSSSGLKIEEDGKVGIGTATPTATLDVDGSAIFNESHAAVDFRVEGDTEANLLFVDGSADMVGIGTATPSAKLDLVGDAEINGAINLPASSTETRNIEIGTGRSGNGTSYIDLIGDATYTDFGLRLIRNSGGANTSSAITHRGTGALYITTSDAASIALQTSGATRFVVNNNGAIRLVAYGAGTLQTDASGNVTASSDERLKNIQGDYTRGLTDIKNIQPITYKWKSSTGNDSINDYSGFSAQNVQANIPEAIGVDPRGYLTISDRPIIAALVNAVNEQQAIIEALKTENETIKAEASTNTTETAQKFAALEAKLNALLLLNSKGAVLTAEN
jgi:hypothetical protein